MNLRLQELPGASEWFQPVAPGGSCTSEALAARLVSSVTVCRTVLVLFQVIVPPTLRQTLAGTNRRESVASTVTAACGLEQVGPVLVLGELLLGLLLLELELALETTVICPSIPKVS